MWKEPEVGLGWEAGIKPQGSLRYQVRTLEFLCTQESKGMRKTQSFAWCPDLKRRW